MMLKKIYAALLTAVVFLALGAGNAFAAGPVASVQAAGCTDLYYWRRDAKDTIMLSEENGADHSFYGLHIGDPKDKVLSTLKPAFSLMYELKAIGHQYLLKDEVYPRYYLAVIFDENDKVMLVTYQENIILHLD